MQLRVPVTLATTALLLAGCVQKPQQALGPSSPNPFGYLKPSAVCETTPLKAAADGSLNSDMKVRSDDGLCSLTVAQNDGTAYASFGVSPAPQHGKAFIYNYNNHTYVTYTPTLAYAGSDSFTATLIPGGGKPRVTLHVNPVVDATGVVVPKPYTPPAATPSTKKSTTSVRKKRTSSHSTAK